jgi:TetR/AcrR family transcriptional regulator, transcriptional repressor for nem operon
MAMKTTGPAQAIQSSATVRILDIAEQLAQTRGFNGFSYADVALELRVTKASLHYHFPSKADLGCALIVRYHLVFAQALEAIDRQTPRPREKLRRYAALYDSVLRKNRMCLCGMFAAEYATLPVPMQNELRLFFDANETWLTAVLEDGRRSGELTFRGAARQRARSVIGALEGAMLVARVYSEPRRFQTVAKQVLADLCSDDAVVPATDPMPASPG